VLDIGGGVSCTESFEVGTGFVEAFEALEDLRCL
jgi:hypothetical protein